MTISNPDQAILLSQRCRKVLPAQSFGVLNSGVGSVGWTGSPSTLPAGGTRLHVTPASGDADAAGNVPSVQVSVDAASLILVVRGKDQFEAKPGSPASPNDVIVMFCAGLGAVSPAVASGAAGGGEQTTNTPTVTIGGVNAPVQFSGLATGFVGLYQIMLWFLMEYLRGTRFR